MKKHTKLFFNYLLLEKMLAPTGESIKSFLSNYSRKILADSHLKHAAVLIPLVYNNGICSVLFTKRTETVAHHKGQVSFPGGKVDPSDKTPEETALRETFEEIGLEDSKIEILGLLDDYITTSGYIVTPCVGKIIASYKLKLNNEEVEESYLIPYSELSAPEKKEIILWEYKGKKYPVVFYHMGLCDVWGVTAAILENFITLLEKI